MYSTGAGISSGKCDRPAQVQSTIQVSYIYSDMVVVRFNGPFSPLVHIRKHRNFTFGFRDQLNINLELIVRMVVVHSRVNVLLKTAVQLPGDESTLLQTSFSVQPRKELVPEVLREREKVN